MDRIFTMCSISNPNPALRIHISNFSLLGSVLDGGRANSRLAFLVRVQLRNERNKAASRQARFVNLLVNPAGRILRHRGPPSRRTNHSANSRTHHGEPGLENSRVPVFHLTCTCFYAVCSLADLAFPLPLDPRQNSRKNNLEESKPALSTGKDPCPPLRNVPGYVRAWPLFRTGTILNLSSFGISSAWAVSP